MKLEKGKLRLVFSFNCIVQANSQINSFKVNIRCHAKDHDLARGAQTFPIRDLLLLKFAQIERV